jgi:hypothetical protein
VRVIRPTTSACSAIVGTRRHQGVVIAAAALSLARNLDELLDASTARRCCWCWTASPIRTTWAPACAWPMVPARMP